MVPGGCPGSLSELLFGDLLQQRQQQQQQQRQQRQQPQQQEQQQQQQSSSLDARIMIQYRARGPPLLLVPFPWVAGNLQNGPSGTLGHA